VRAHALLALALVVASACARDARGAFEVNWPDARSAAMAGADGGLLGTVGRLASEGPGPAAGARWDLSFSGGRLYGLPEATGSVARASARYGSTSVAAELGRFGSDLYAEHTVGVLAARPVAAESWWAIRIRAVGIAAEGVDDRWSAATDAALARRVLGRVSLGVAYENLGGAKIGGSPITSSARVGAVLKLDTLVLAISVTEEQGFTPSLAVGCEAAMSAWLRLRGGVTTEPGRFAVGLGFGEAGRPATSRRPVLDVAWEWHPELEVSTFVTVSYRL
jgi:hypothetical protein